MLTCTSCEGVCYCDGQVHGWAVVRVSGTRRGDLEGRLIQALDLGTVRPGTSLVARHAYAQIPVTTALELQIICVNMIYCANM